MTDPDNSDRPETVTATHPETGEDVEVPTHIKQTELAAWFGTVPDSWDIDRVFEYDGTIRTEAHLGGGEWVETIYQTEGSRHTMTNAVGWVAEHVDGQPPSDRIDAPGVTVWEADR